MATKPAERTRSKSRKRSDGGPKKVKKVTKKKVEKDVAKEMATVDNGIEPAPPKPRTPKPQTPDSGVGNGVHDAPLHSHESPPPPLSATIKEGTIKGPSKEDFNPEIPAEKLRKAFKGLGTDEKTVIDILASHTNRQRQEFKKTYKTMYGRDLIGDIEGELGGHFLETVLALMCPSHLYDAYCLRKAMEGLGTDEEALIEILCTRSNSEIELAKEAYRKEFGRRLEDDVKSETSSGIGRLLQSMVNAGRDVNDKVDKALADVEAAKLLTGGVGQLGTNEEVFNQVLALRSFPQIAATMDAYKRISQRSLDQDVRKEFSGDLKKGLLTIMKIAKHPTAYFAERLHECIQGIGTNDDALIRIIVSRSEIDLTQIKEEFHQRYKMSLPKAVQSDCSGDYGRLLLRLLKS